jgi:hypothetical protein
MTYPISTARKRLYDAITAALPGVAIFDAIADDEAPVPFVVMDSFTTQPGTRCGYEVVCRISLYDQFTQRGGNIRADQLGEKLLTVCEGLGTDVTITTGGVRTFNRANYRQQFQVTI